MVAATTHGTGPAGQVRLQVKFPGAPPTWALSYGSLLENHPDLRLVSLRIISPEQAEFTISSRSPAGLAATLLALPGLPAESVEVRGDSLFTLIAERSRPPGLSEVARQEPVRARDQPSDPASQDAPAASRIAQVTPIRQSQLSLVGGDGWAGSGSRADADHLSVAVGPFSKFSAVNRFIEALGSMHDVHSVKPRRFRRGTLYALVDYVGAAPFATVLASLRDFPLRVTGTSEDRVEATLLEREGEQLREIA